jgi:glycosyltransferase involved in cell wall biosynthesis
VKWHLVVDMRKAFDAGIGTYIRNVVPRVLDRLGTGVRAAALVPAGQEGRFDWLSTQRGPQRVPTLAAPMSLAEQFELRRHLCPGTLFWATSLAHPLWRRGPLVATVYDVAQLALGRGEGMSAHVAWAAKTLLTNQRRRASALLAISDFTRREFIRYVGPAACGRIHVTPLGVDRVWFDAEPAGRERAGTPYFICVGSVRPHKNIERLLQAFASVADRLPHELVIAGLGYRAGEHTRWHAALPPAAQARVRFTGFVEELALRGLVVGADALVFPSVYEGFGLPVLEAMAAGCPVLSSNAGALPEVCGEAAVVSFDPRSVEAIGQALLQHAALSGAERHAIVARGVAHARTFNWDRTADRTAEVIGAALHAADVAK